MKHSRFLLLTLLLVIAALLCSCDLLAQYVPGLIPATTTNEVTTMTTTDSAPASTTAPTAVTTAPVTTATVTTAPVTTAPRVTVNERTPAGAAVNLFDGNLATYAVGYETGAESAASTLAAALGKTAASYDATVAKSIRLAIKTNGTVTLGAGDYHLYADGKTVTLLGGDAAGLAAAVDAFLATVEDGVSSLSPYHHVIHRATPPAKLSAAEGILAGTTVEKDPLEYEIGEVITFHLKLKKSDKSAFASCDSFEYTIKADDVDPADYITGTVDGASGELVITIPASFTQVEGSVRLTVKAKLNGTTVPSLREGGTKDTSYTYIGGAYVAMTEIREHVTMNDEDFLAFWKNQLSTLKDPTRKVPAASEYKNGFRVFKMDAAYMRNALDPQYVNIDNAIAKLATHDCYEIYLNTDSTNGGRPAIAYVTIPKNAAPGSLPINVGFNSRSLSAGFFTTSNSAICVRVHPCGLPWSEASYNSVTGLVDFEKTDFASEEHYGLAREDYEENLENAYFAKMLMRNIQMLRYLTDDSYAGKLPRGESDTNIYSSADVAAFRLLHEAYNGTIIGGESGSMGGYQMIATAALATFTTKDGELLVNGTWDKVAVRCPWGADHASISNLTGRLPGTGTWIGDPNKVGANVGINMANLSYFDMTQFARFVPEDCLVIIKAGWADTVCSSTGIAATYNALRGEKQLSLTQNYDHTGTPPADKSFVSTVSEN